MLLFDGFGGCLDEYIVLDIDCDSFKSIFDVRESLEGFDAFVTTFGNTTANRNRMVIRREDGMFDIFKADALVDTCRVSATELEMGFPEVKGV